MVQLVLASVRERTRSAGFRLALALALFLAYSVSAGRFTFHWGAYRPAGDAAWQGWNAGLFLLMFISFPGFYFVKNAVEIDRHTGTSQLLAAAPLGNLGYVWSKVLGNTAYLGLVAVAYVLAFVLGSFVQGTLGADLGAFLVPLCLLVLPVLLATAATAVCFEATAWLRGSLGNVLYFLLWVTLVGLSSAARSPQSIDILGFGFVRPAVKGAVAAAFPGEVGFWDMSLRPEAYTLFAWSGVPLTHTLVLHRLAWALPFFLLPMASALVLDQVAAARATPRWTERARARLADLAASSALLSGRLLVRTPLPSAVAHWQGRSQAAYLFFNEIALLFRGRNVLWYAAVLWLNCYALFLAKGYDLRYTAFPFLLILPLAIWSEMGFQERFFNVHPVLYATNLNLARHALVSWGAALVLVLMMMSGLVVKAIWLKDGHLLLIVLAAAGLAPAVALASGAASGSRRPFEAVFALCWYAGPVEDYYLFAQLYFTPYTRLAGLAVATIGASALLVLAAGRFKGREGLRGRGVFAW
jgi:hypothetical protein